jgi:hypothetical protein
MSHHFSIREATFSSIAGRMNINNAPDDEVLKAIYASMDHLEAVRNVLGKPMHIDSWYRSPALNKEIKGSKSKRGHISGYCIDFICPAFGNPQSVCYAILDAGIKFDQLIYEGGWVHISFHPAMRQTVLTAHFSRGKKTTYTKGIEQ